MVPATVVGAEDEAEVEVETEDEERVRERETSRVTVMEKERVEEEGEEEEPVIDIETDWVSIDATPAGSWEESGVRTEGSRVDFGEENSPHDVVGIETGGRDVKNPSTVGPKSSVRRRRRRRRQFTRRSVVGWGVGGVVGGVWVGWSGVGWGEGGEGGGRGREWGGGKDVLVIWAMRALQEGSGSEAEAEAATTSMAAHTSANTSASFIPHP